MQDKKRRLTMVGKENASRVVEGTTCFAIVARANVGCQRKTCPHWINHPDGLNCVHVATKRNGSHTLQVVGQIYELTRMRICQIEKSIFEKIRSIS